MSVRVRMTLVVLVLLAAAPGPALAGVCFNVTGLPEAAGIDLVPLPVPAPGPVPVVGQAQGVCGLGQPPLTVQGTASVDSGGTARIGIKLLAARPGCSGGDAELVLPPPYAAGTGQVRLPEGSVTNVGLTQDTSGQACRIHAPRPTACVGSAFTLCLLQNRFRVAAVASTGNQNLPGQVKNFSSESGFFTFVDTSNVELVVKVLDGRGVNNFYWVAVTTPSNIDYTLTVTDTQTGRLRTYSKPVGAAAPAPILDSTAFSAMP